MCHLGGSPIRNSPNGEEGSPCRQGPTAKAVPPISIDHYQYLVFKEKEGLLCSNPSFGFINAITDILVGTEEGF